MTTQDDQVQVELALDAHCNLGESPVWDGKTETLYFVDIYENKVRWFKPSTGEASEVTLDQPPGTIVPTSDPDRILVAGARGILELDVPGRKLTGRVLAETPEEHGVDGYRFNDGKVTPKGTLLVGRMSTRWRDGEPGRLYRLDPGSSVLVEVMGPSEVMLPNGIAWDERKPGVVYYIDSRTEAVRAYTADAEGVPLRDPSTGQLGYRTVTHRPNNWKTVPDGMTIDADGRLWVAHGESGAVTQYDPETGEVLRTVALPVQRPTACTFGGPGLEDLYVTTRVEQGEGASPHHGGLFRIRIPGVRGAAPAYDYPLS